ncbi:MAG: hypothetical protein ACK5RG_06415 [Cyclobacteriaceae bacterium]|jgi:hypothetical protein|nr:hypothetical protein [Flammeovirgaceae bacterium]
MKTLVINFSNDQDLQLVKDLAMRLNAEIENLSVEERRHRLSKSKFKSEEEFRSIGGIAKDQLISKDHIREIAWKKRD